MSTFYLLTLFAVGSVHAQANSASPPPWVNLHRIGTTRYPYPILTLPGPISKKVVDDKEQQDSDIADPTRDPWDTSLVTWNPFINYGGPISKKDVNDGDMDDISVPALVALITSTIDNTQKGISISDLAEAIEKVKNLADNLLANRGGQADLQDVVDLIKEVGRDINDGSVDISVLFDEPMKFEARTLAFGLRLLVELASRLTQVDEEGGQLDTILATISTTCDLIQSALDNTVHLMSDLVKGGNPPLERRQSVTGSPSLSLEVEISKTYDFDNGSSLELFGKGTTDFNTGSVNFGLRWNF